MAGLVTRMLPIWNLPRAAHAHAAGCTVGAPTRAPGNMGDSSPFFKVVEVKVSLMLVYDASTQSAQDPDLVVGSPVQRFRVLETILPHSAHTPSPLAKNAGQPPKPENEPPLPVWPPADQRDVYRGGRGPKSPSKRNG